MLLPLMKILVILMKTQLVMVPATKFLPLSSTEAACDVAATDEDPGDTDVEKDSVGDDNDADEDPGDTDEDSGGDGGWYKVLASLLYRACL